MAFEIVGLKAVLDGIGKYANDARTFDTANERMGRSVDDVDRKSRAAAGGVSKLGIAIGAAAGTIAANAITAATSAIGSQVGRFIGDASNLAESVSKVNVVFGESAGEIQAWAKTAATSIGASTQQALEAAGTYGNLFQAFGVGRKESTAMSKSLVELAADLASFNNTSTDDALLALRSGLSGETEPLKRFGVALTDDRLKLEAVKLGLISTTKDALTPGAKAQAAYNLIMHDTALAQGDFGRTSAGLANQQRILTANITNLRARIGTGLLPIVTKVVQFLNQKGIPAFERLATILGPRLAAIMAALRTRLNPDALRRFTFAADFARDVLRDLFGILQGGARAVAAAIRFIRALVTDIAAFVRTGLILVNFLRTADDDLFALGLAFRPLPAPIKAVADVLRDLIRFVDRVTQPVRDLARGLGAIVDPSRLAAGGIAAFVAVLAAAEAVKFASAVATTAANFLTWPLKAVQAATGTLLDFGKALLGIPSRKIAEEAGEAATGIGDDCHDKIARCIHKPEVDAASLAETETVLDGLAQDRDVKVHPKVQKSESLKAGIIKGLTQGIGAGIGLALARVVGLALVAAGPALAAAATTFLLPVLAVIAVIAVVALVGFLIYKFRREIGRFFVNVGKVLLKGLQNIPEILGGIAAAGVAAFLIAFIVLPFLLVRQIVRTIKALVPILADIGKTIGPPIGRALAAVPGIVLDALREVPRIVPRLFKLAVDAGVKEIKALPGQIVGLPDNIGRIFRAIPGKVADALDALRDVIPRAFRAGLDLLPGIVRQALDGILAYIRSLPGRFGEGFRAVWDEVNRQTDNSLNTVVRTVTDIARNIGSALRDGIVAGFRGALSVPGDVFSALRTGLVDFINREVVDRLNDLLEFEIDTPGPGSININPPDIPRVPGGSGTRGGGTSATGDPVFGFARGTPFIPRDMFAFLHKGERVVDAPNNRLLGMLAGGLMARPAAQAGPTSLLVPITVYAQGGGLTEASVKRLIHLQVDRTFTLSRRRTVRAGRQLTSGTG